MDAAAGTLIWRFQTGGFIDTSSPSLSADGSIVYIGSYDKQVWALYTATGAVAWNYTTQASIESSPAVGPTGIIYFGSLDFNVYALNGTTGALLWSYPTSSYVYSSPAVGTNGVVYVGSHGTSLRIPPNLVWPAIRRGNR